MTDQDDSDERRTEGVRIIGAQEAAEAAGRPDVVRRRRRSEKKFGDRPDKPEPTSDLPKIKISTTETGADPGGTFGAVPVVRARSKQGQPKWRDEGDPDGEGQERPKVGHARIIDSEPKVVDESEPKVLDESEAEPEAVDLTDAESEVIARVDDAADKADQPSTDSTAETEVVEREKVVEPDNAVEREKAVVPESVPKTQEPVVVAESVPKKKEPVVVADKNESSPDAGDETEIMIDVVDETENEAGVVDETDDEVTDRSTGRPGRLGSQESSSGEEDMTKTESYEEVFGTEPEGLAFAKPTDSIDDHSTGTGLDDSDETEDPDDETGTWDARPTFLSSTPDDGSGDKKDDWVDAVDNWAIDEPFADGSDDVLGESDDGDTFVLPHWTEPATGQVPKVVTGVDQEQDATFAERPRWRDEGEREGVTDFADLVDEGPRLGALGEPVDDDDTDLFDDDLDSSLDDGFDDFFEDEEPQFEEPTRHRERRAAARRSERDSAVDKPSGGDRNLTTALLVGLGLVAIGLGSFWLGGLATTILIAVILVVATTELTDALNSSGFSTPNLVVVPAVLGLVLGTYFAGLDAYPVVLGLTVITAMLWYLWITPGARTVRDMGATLLAVMWVGFLGSFATLMLGLGEQMRDIDTSLKSNPGIGVMIAAVIIAVSHDVGAYFTGRYLGSNSFSAASPNKTVEGLAGGVLSGIIAAVIVVGFFHIHPIGDSIARTIVFAALCSMVAPLGDLCESALKRDLRIKDLGSALPGHGGVLDRFDAMLFVLPTAYFVSTLMGIWTVSPG